MKKIKVILVSLLLVNQVYAQVTPNINSGDPNFPFPQFKSYVGASNTLANQNPVGVTHAEMEQRIRDGYTILCNNMTYDINKGGSYGPQTVNGVKYIMPNQTPTSDIAHCTCVEGDGYYLLAAAYMADQATFNGYYMWMHDRQFQKTQRFIDGSINSSGYNYSPGISGAGSAGTSTDVLGGGLSGNSATDGDVDVALALLVAWKQWGDNATICVDPLQGPIYYKTEAIKYIKTLVDTVVYTPSLPAVTYITGDIGLDGYHKGGDSWHETTNWATGGAWKGLIPQSNGPQTNYVDYAAPGYFRSFSDMLTAEAESAWCIDQYKRGEASDDWLIGQAYTNSLIPWAGNYSVTGTTASFTNFADGEDFRFGWRTILNYMWNGSPSRTWDPSTHNYTNTTNTYEYDMAARFATFLKNTQAAPYNNASQTFNTLTYCGPPTNLDQYSPDGTAGSGFPLNWIHGTGSPAAVVSQDQDLMAQMFRECVIRWDQYDASGGTGGSQAYLTSKPRYFHEWFRLLGMLILTGNYHDPMDFDATVSNMKVYKAVDKTYAYVGDTLTYTISYRNYAKATASGVVITDALPAGLTFLSASNGGTNSGGTVTWNIGSVTGFVTGGLAATTGYVTLKVIVNSSATGRLCNVTTITTTNGSGWISNEYPNNITEVMERNCVDILTTNPLTITKTASKSTVQVGDTLSYTIVVKNQSVDFLNGGRPGVVVAGANGGLSASAPYLNIKYRFYHGAHEPYINYQNYRISYFLNKPGPPTWIVTQNINPPEGTGAPFLTQQTLSAGATWNHRFLINFPDSIATITPFLYFYSGQTRYIHQGATVPFRIGLQIGDAGPTNYNWTTDWSSEAAGLAADADPFWPIANDWTDPLNPNLAVTKYHPNNCSNNVTTTLTKQLVEEWDGYTWRRIYGSAPVSGRELYNIVVKDTLPAEVTFGGYFSGYPTGTLSGSVITWPTITSMNVNDSVVYKFWVTVKDATYFNCPSGPTPGNFINNGYAKADNNPAAYASVTTNVSCTAVPVFSSSVTKTANASSYSTNDPITYTIKYKNLGGTTVSGATSGTDWVSITGGTMSVNASGDIDLNTSWTTKAMYYKYSHGTNGYIKGMATLAQYQTIYAVIFRYNGATYNEVRFSVQNTYVAVSVYNMPANTQIGTTQNIAYSTCPAAFDYQLQLNGNTLNIWLGNTGTVFSPIPDAIITGITVQAGYAGVRSSVGSAATLSNWYTQLDSEFNLQMADPIPAEITYVNGSSATYNSVNYTVSNSAGTLTWQTIPGPILVNDSVMYTWTGKVSSCASGNITNTATAKVYGVTPDPANQVIVSCLVPTPVSLIDFGAFPDNMDVMLNWSTASEINNKEFVIMRSLDGITYDSIAAIPGSGNNLGIRNYNYKDINAGDYNDEVYYKLVQVDYNGKINPGKAVKVNFSGVDNVIIYPNPFTTNTKLKILSRKNQDISLKIFMITGELVYNSEQYKTNQVITLGDNLSNGVYFLEVIYNDNVKVFKLVKDK